MFIYYNAKQARNLDYRGPDFFFVRNVPLNPCRLYWAIWDEGGRYPDVIIELSSPSTIKIDHEKKKDIYEQIFHTFEYFICNPDNGKLYGWRLHNQRYRPIEPDKRGFLWSEELELWLGLWKGKYLGKEGVWLRFFDKDGNLTPTSEEWANSEVKNAEVEKQRADAAEAELARLRTERGKNGNGRKKKNQQD